MQGFQFTFKDVRFCTWIQGLSFYTKFILSTLIKIDLLHVLDTLMRISVLFYYLVMRNAATLLEYVPK